MKIEYAYLKDLLSVASHKDAARFVREFNATYDNGKNQLENNELMTMINQVIASEEGSGTRVKIYEKSARVIQPSCMVWNRLCEHSEFFDIELYAAVKTDYNFYEMYASLSDIWDGGDFNVAYRIYRRAK